MLRLIPALLFTTIILVCISCQKDITITTAVQDSTITPPGPADSLLSKFIVKDHSGNDSIMVTYQYNSAKQVIEEKFDDIAGGIAVPDMLTSITRDASGKITRIVFTEFPYGPDTTYVTYVPSTTKVAYTITIANSSGGGTSRDSTVYEYTGTMISRTLQYYYDAFASAYVLDSKDYYQYDASGNLTTYVDTAGLGSGMIYVHSGTYTYDTHKGPYKLTNTENILLDAGMLFGSKNNVIKEVDNSGSGSTIANWVYTYNTSDKPLTVLRIDPATSDTTRYRFFYKL
jgi:hypothetical protein